MKFAHHFIDRPVLASVLSIVIVVVGAFALTQLPVAQYPDIVPPTVSVSATFPGADAKTVAETVAAPIEQEVNGVENMLYMSSTSSNEGAMSLLVTFNVGTDLNMAQVLVQNRVASALPKLPEEVRRLGVTTTKQSPTFTLCVNLVAPKGTRDEIYLSNYALLNIKDSLARVKGVGKVDMVGGRDYSMRIWLDPDKMASLSLTPGDVTAAVQEQNVQVAAGSVGRPPAASGVKFQYVISAQGRLRNVEEFGAIIIKEGAEGQLVRLRDVARIEIGAQDYSTNSYVDGKPTVTLMVYQQPGSNALETAERVRKEMEEKKAIFPEDLDYSIVYDTSVFIEESVSAVEHTFIEAVVLVVIVVLVFLQSWRATIIPLIAVPVSIIGTFAAMAALGFSVNNLTLFGLILAIGIVVDDAIIVVENVERNMALGLLPKEATRRAMDEVGGPIIAVALVLVAVFVPTAFITGLSGQFYRQFAVTIAISTVISAFNSLTLSPALCAILLKPHGGKKDAVERLLNGLFGWFFRLFNRFFDSASSVYSRMVGRMIRLSAICLLIYAGLIVLTWLGFRTVPQGFVPPQDKGYLIVNLQMPAATAIGQTDAVTRRLIEIVGKERGVKHTLAFVGFSAIGGAGPDGAMVIALLDDFNKRTAPELQSDAILASLQAKTATEAREGLVNVFGPPPVDGIGSMGGFRLMVQDRNGIGLDALQEVTANLSDAAAKKPEIAAVFSSFRADQPQIYLEIDREQAKSMRLPVSSVFEALQVFLGSAYVNDFTLFGRSFQVTAQADTQFRMRPDQLRQLKARNLDGKMVPLASVVTVKEVAGPSSVTRYNLYPAADLNGMEAQGFSSGQAIEAMQKVAANLPRGFGYEWTDLTYQQLSAGNTAMIVFPMAVLFVLLTLAGQYESWSLPFSIILIVPMCLFSSIGGLLLVGMDNNIFTQIGFVVLIALAAKNAILIVEVAKQKEDAGQSRLDATVEACKLRLRPIIMTSLAFICGIIPLALAKGAGAEMRVALGTGVFWGMLGVTLFGIFFTPVFYSVIRGFVRKRTTPEN